MLPLGFRLFAAQNPVATGGNFRGKQVAFWHQGAVTCHHFALQSLFDFGTVIGFADYEVVARDSRDPS